MIRQTRGSPIFLAVATVMLLGCQARPLAAERSADSWEGPSAGGLANRHELQVTSVLENGVAFDARSSPRFEALFPRPKDPDLVKDWSKLVVTEPANQIRRVTVNDPAGIKRTLKDLGVSTEEQSAAVAKIYRIEVEYRIFEIHRVANRVALSAAMNSSTLEDHEIEALRREVRSNTGELCKQDRSVGEARYMVVTGIDWADNVRAVLHFRSGTPRSDRESVSKLVRGPVTTRTIQVRIPSTVDTIEADIGAVHIARLTASYLLVNSAGQFVVTDSALGNARDVVRWLDTGR